MLFQLGATIVNQVVTDVIAAWIARRVFSRYARHIKHVLSDLHFIVRTVARQHFDHVAVVVAGCEMHQRVNTGGIFTQGLFDLAHGFDKFCPIHFA
ncbi:hypothetical protein D3C72_1238270 [compost metagenome]